MPLGKRAQMPCKKDGSPKKPVAEGFVYCPYSKETSCVMGHRLGKAKGLIVDGQRKELFRCFNAEVANLGGEHFEVAELSDK